jgi:hypothetical protein
MKAIVLAAVAIPLNEAATQPSALDTFIFRGISKGKF